MCPQLGFHVSIWLCQLEWVAGVVREILWDHNLGILGLVVGSVEVVWKVHSEYSCQSAFLREVFVLGIHRSSGSPFILPISGQVAAVAAQGGPICYIILELKPKGPSFKPSNI